MFLNSFFAAECGTVSFKLSNILQIFKISFLFDLFTNNTRKIAESIQAKASLTKPWLATDKANRSPVVWEQFAVC